MRETNYHKFIELLGRILRCPVCNAKYTADETNIVTSQDRQQSDRGAMMVHADCNQCKSSVVFSISMDGQEIFSLGMVTDLTSRDAGKFCDNASISADQVIEFHEFLQGFDGNFERVLR